MKLNFKSTQEIKVSKEIANQVIGQEEALEKIKKASGQRRHVLLIGDPGVGKSLVGQALAEMLPKEELKDILSINNPDDENNPKIKEMPSGEGKKLVQNLKLQSKSFFTGQNLFLIILVVLSALMPWWIRSQYGDVMGAASLIGSMFVLAMFIILLNINRRNKLKEANIPKLLVNSSEYKQAPFFDATGSHAGALLGDVLHDPFQSGGLGTPAYERIVPGMIHRANKGVLFIDEIATLRPETQQELLTALQEKKYSITGQSERSAGAMVRTDPVPCDFILVAAGNLETIKNIHPALRSRIRGYGYEIYMNNHLEDTQENRYKLAIFVAQEVKKDGKIPHFSKNAVEEIILEAKKRSGKSKKLTLHLRDLGGLVRAAGDIALEENSDFVLRKHVIQAKKSARSLEQQMADRYIETKKDYDVIKVRGSQVGRVNGLAVIGSEISNSGIVLPIESEITPGGKKSEFVATGNLGNIAKEAVKNVSAIIMKYYGEDIKEKYDIYVQFLQASEGVEGDSASIAVATAIFSALKKVPVKQEVAMTGSLSVRGEVLAVGGITSKIEAAIEAGIKKIILPKSNLKDIVLKKSQAEKIKIIPVSNINQVLKNSLDWKGKESVWKKINKQKA